MEQVPMNGISKKRQLTEIICQYSNDNICLQVAVFVLGAAAEVDRVTTFADLSVQ
jgi:hypothetical protein